ncbi:hypothetical protein SAMN04488556_3037 [Halostagnicola kamekurae]|uniref:Uncharacterized protein n=1 Tax=Halostagnicola kamekurae TaxID=619731 RepID=A0A1I6TE24_9EURY|nr:hypothetical protein SAMN04488556_3037 [Halostagnicola kamekurae]
MNLDSGFVHDIGIADRKIWVTYYLLLQDAEKTGFVYYRFHVDGYGSVLLRRKHW